jgi:hypothetical protein
MIRKLMASTAVLATALMTAPARQGLTNVTGSCHSNVLLNEIFWIERRCQAETRSTRSSSSSP